MMYHIIYVVFEVVKIVWSQLLGFNSSNTHQYHNWKKIQAGTEMCHTGDRI